MSNLFLNVTYDAYENTEAAARSLFPYLDRVANGAIHITTGARKEQGRAFALQLKARYPAMDVILRILPDENPANHQRYTPDGFVAAFAPWAAGGLILSLNNEAGVGDIAAQNTWYTAVIEQLGKQGIRCAAPSTQTHNPFPPEAFDSTYRMLSKYDGIFLLHYYFDPEHGIPIMPLLEPVTAYCKAHGIALKTGISELGYAEDLAPQAGAHGRLSSAVYAQQLVDAGKRWPDVKFFVYCWGNQAPWGDFDISQDNVIQDALVKHNQENVPVTPPIYSDGVNPAPKVIDASAGLKLRGTPSLAGVVVRVMAYRETVTVYAAPVIPADGYNWQRVTDSKGLVGWSANYVDGKPSWVDPLSVDTPLVSLPVPHVPQVSGSANHWRNDCLVASCLMALRYRFVEESLLDPLLMTVDELAAKTSLPLHDDGLTSEQGAALLKGYGVPAQRVILLTSNMVKQMLNDGTPVIPLVNYKWINPAQKTDLGHFMTVFAYGSNGVWVNDPYLLGANTYVTFAALDKALSDVSAFASTPNQGVILTS